MCDPFTIAGLALTAASTAASAISSRKVEKNRNRAQVAENQRQRDLQNKSIDAVQETQKNFDPALQREQLAAAEQARADDLARNATGGGFSVSDIPIAGSAPRVVRETAAKELSEGIGRGKDFAKNLGVMGGFGDLQFDNRLMLQNLGEQQGLLARESAGSSAILPLELQKANRSGNTLAGVGDILGGLGSVANLAGATGYNPFGSAAVAPTPYTPALKQRFA